MVTRQLYFYFQHFGRFDGTLPELYEAAEPLMDDNSRPDQIIQIKANLEWKNYQPPTRSADAEADEFV